MSERIKRPAAQAPTRGEMEKLVGEIRDLKIQELNLVADREAKIKSIDEHFARPLTRVREDWDEKSALVQLWAEANPQEFAKRKSIELTHGTIGFRTGTPKLKPIGKWKWDQILTQFKLLVRLRVYVRTAEEVDRERTIADFRAGEIDREILFKAGCEVAQEEKFFVQPKIENAEIK